jgi:hypothetical protein
MMASAPAKQTGDKKGQSSEWEVRWLKYGLLALLIGMPFHAFFSVWFGHLIGHETLIQSWKEVVTVALVVLAVVVANRYPERLTRLMRPMNYWALAFILTSLVVTAIMRPSLTGIIFGLKIDIEFLVLFFIAQLVADDGMIRLATKLLLVTTAVVSVFGAAQAFLLPHDFLTNFGYGPQTVAPFLRVDPASPAIRILSTLGGPNQLGAYLIMPICLVIALLIRKIKWWHFLLLAAMLITLEHSYSRSAWIGAVAAVFVTIALILPKRHVAYFSVITVLLAVVLIQVSIGYINRGGGGLQYILFHVRASSQSIAGSDAQHVSAQVAGLKAALAHPLGEGLGTSGPASKYTPTSNITEDYYLQLAIETGIAGMLAFVVFLGVVAYNLFSLRPDPMAVALCGGLVGISVVNFLLHGWADSSLAFVYWILAGLTTAKWHKPKAG